MLLHHLFYRSIFTPQILSFIEFIQKKKNLISRDGKSKKFYLAWHMGKSFQDSYTWNPDYEVTPKSSILHINPFKPSILLWGIGKQGSHRSDVWSGSPLFAYRKFY